MQDVLRSQRRLRRRADIIAKRTEVQEAAIRAFVFGGLALMIVPSVAVIVIGFTSGYSLPFTYS